MRLAEPDQQLGAMLGRLKVELLKDVLQHLEGNRGGNRRKDDLIRDIEQSVDRRARAASGQ